MALRREESTVVARHGILDVFLFVGAVDEMAQLADVLVEPRARAAVVFGEIFQWCDEPRQREFLIVSARLWLDGQKRTAFGVENKKQPVEKNQAGIVKLRQVGVGDLVFRALSETVGEDFDDGEDALAQVFF